MISSQFCYTLPFQGSSRYNKTQVYQCVHHHCHHSHRPVFLWNNIRCRISKLCYLILWNMFQFFMLYLWTPKVYTINECKRYIYFQQRVVVKISVASHAYINLIILKHYFCRPTPFWSGWEFDSMASYHPLSCLWFSLW